LAENNEWINYHEPDFKSEEGRPIPYVYLSKDRSNYNDTDEVNEQGRKKLRLWFQGGVHGDEPVGTQALLALLGKLNTEKEWASSVLDKVDILVLPQYNPDGVEYFQRSLVSGFDGNRDHAVLQRQQTRDIKELLNAFDPHIGLDAHEYTASGRVAGHVKAQDVQFSAVKNPNIRSEIRQLGEGIFTATVFAAVREAGFRTGPYFTASGSPIPTLTEPGSISQAGHNSWGLGQRLTFLFETRGIRLGDQHFKRRTAAGLLAASTLLQVAVDKHDLVYDTIEDARASFITSDDEIVVVDKSRVIDTTMQVINASNGTLIDIPVKYNNNTPSDVVISRRRPEAYIFSAAWNDIAERLRVLGVEVDALQSDFYDTVETLVVTNVTLASSRHEGIVQATVRIPAGGYRVSTRQKNAAFAFVTLEPENIASFVTYNKIPLNSGEEYPVFRVY
jgi:hypothetical protein